MPERTSTALARKRVLIEEHPLERVDAFNRPFSRLRLGEVRRACCPDRRLCWKKFPSLVRGRRKLRHFRAPKSAPKSSPQGRRLPPPRPRPRRPPRTGNRLTNHSRRPLAGRRTALSAPLRAEDPRKRGAFAGTGQRPQRLPRAALGYAGGEPRPVRPRCRTHGDLRQRLQHRLKLAAEQSSDDWAVVEWRVRASDEPPLHTHTREDETVYVLEGAITAYVGGEKTEVEVVSYAALPKNVPHGLTVRGDEARLLITLEPGARSTSWCRAMTRTPIPRSSVIVHEAARRCNEEQRMAGAPVRGDHAATRQVRPAVRRAGRDRSGRLDAGNRCCADDGLVVRVDLPGVRRRGRPW
jgi:quercetin dioxygenase-like cupin family protein